MSWLIVERAVYSVLSLYMLLILVRWLGGYLELNLYDIRLRWIGHVVDPVVGVVRRLLPNMGPMDFGPLATLLIVWLVRVLALSVIGGAAVRPIGV